MIGDLGLRVLEAWTLAAILQLILWLVQQRTKNAGIVDVGWAGSFALVAILFAIRAAPETASLNWLPLMVLVAGWSARLTLYLIARGAAASPEEGRYVDLRTRWGGAASFKFFVFFQAQAALVGILATAFTVPFIEAPWSGTGWVRSLGMLVTLAGIVGESIADAQLLRFKRDPANKGQVCDVGLWSWSRHPNYFFEWCVWIGYAVYGFAFGAWGLIAIAPQAIIVGSIFGITGIPPTENQESTGRDTCNRVARRARSPLLAFPLHAVVGRHRERLRR